jgi:hypothetical protein
LLLRQQINLGIDAQVITSTASIAQTTQHFNSSSQYSKFQHANKTDRQTQQNLSPSIGTTIFAGLFGLLYLTIDTQQIPTIIDTNANR